MAYFGISLNNKIVAAAVWFVKQGFAERRAP
jgi:hypothetical protein